MWFRKNRETVETIHQKILSIKTKKLKKLTVEQEMYKANQGKFHPESSTALKSFETPKALN